MKRSTWVILILFLGTLAVLIATPLITTNAAVLATDTRWPTVTPRPTDTRVPTNTLRLTDTRVPSATLRLTDTRWPTTATSTRWPTKITPPTDTRVPTVTTRPTDTRVPSATLRPTDTRVPSSTPKPTDTRWPTTARTSTRTPTWPPGVPTWTLTPTRSLTRRPTDTRWPTVPTSTRQPTVTLKPTDTRWPVPPTNTRWPVPPTNTRWPTARTLSTDTRVPSATVRLTDTHVPTSPIKPTDTRWPTITKGSTSTRTPTQVPSSTPTPTLSPSPTTNPANWPHYTNNSFGFTFNYPPDATITDQQDNYVQIYMTILPATNLVGKYVEVYASQGIDLCSGHYGGTNGGTVTINGHSFNVQTGDDRGAGQIHEWTSYATVQGNVCVSFNFILHSGNIDMYPPGTPLFDKAAESAVFTQILNTFNWLPATPTPSAGLTMGPFAVVKVKSNDVLNIRAGAGSDYAVIGSYPYNAANILRAGPIQSAGGVNWYQVLLPVNGTGWVSSLYLTEQTASSTFCGDGRVQALFGQLQSAVNSSNGTLFASLVSPPRGLDVLYWHSGNIVTYTAAQAAGVFTSPAQQNWGAGPSGEDTLGTFTAIVQPALQEVFNAAYESYCNNPKAAGTLGVPWAYEYTNFNYYSIYKPGTPGVDIDYKQWMAGIDYYYGKPYLAALVRVIWEP